MTRKRFTKLLRGKGYSRHEINQWIELASCDMSYAEIFKTVTGTFEFRWRSIGISFRKFQKSIVDSMSPVLTKAADALSGAFRRD